VKASPLAQNIDVLLHEPARLRVLTLLAMVEEADFMYLLRQTGLSRGNLSVQMTKLEAAGVVRLDRQLDGTRPRTTYTLSKSGRDALRRYKRTMASLLDQLPD
jgi:DNA-binding MarR family transcriptional regulator